MKHPNRMFIDAIDVLNGSQFSNSIFGVQSGTNGHNLSQKGETLEDCSKA